MADHFPPFTPAFRPQPKPRKPARDKEYLGFVRGHACTICSRPAPSHAHHDGPRGMSQKTSDYRTLPLCDEHHTMEHAGNLPWFDDAAKAAVMRELLVEFLEVGDGF
jgi:hypothetical protein